MRKWPPRLSSRDQRGGGDHQRGDAHILDQLIARLLLDRADHAQRTAQARAIAQDAAR